ncbi:hypothetical protein G3T14_23225 [Methylobacterium sp. BTF04]|nr:hypothetical protein [Methylobacterium sp. BTF04]
MAELKKKFISEFRAEAVRLIQISCRYHREIAADLGVGRSTLRNGINSQRDREMDALPAGPRSDSQPSR